MKATEIKKGQKVVNTFTDQTGVVVGLGKKEVRVLYDDNTKTQCSITFFVDTFELL